MSTMKLTAFFAVMAMATGVATAQPAGTTTTTAKMRNAQEAPAKAGRGQAGGAQAGPFAKLQVAKNLPSITDEQRQTLDAFIEQRKPQADAMREEMRTAMQQAKQATDRESRQAIMQPLRQKVEAAEQEISALLSATLTPEQLTQVNQKAGDRMKQAGRERMRDNDNMSTGAKAAKSAKAGKKGAKGKKDGKSKKAGKDGKRFNRETAPAVKDSATTGSAAPNPFVEE